MKPISARGLRAGLAVPALFAFAAAATFVGLGIWQLERKAWKEELIARLDQRLNAIPTELPARDQWESLAQADHEFRRVKLRVAFQSGREALVYAAGSAFRPDVKAPGYFAFAPARTRDGALVVVNRGYLPQPRGEPERHPPPAGAFEIIGALRWPESSNPFVRSHDAASDTWFVRDHLQMAARNGWGAVAPFYVEMESPQPPDGLPRAGGLRPNLRNEHLQYAITWFSLAVVVVAMFGVWLINGRRNRP